MKKILAKKLLDIPPVILPEPKLIYRKLISTNNFFRLVLSNQLQLVSSTDKEGSHICSWKVDGEEFYCYGKKI